MVAASPTSYIVRFGSLRAAYEKIGYGRASTYERVDLRNRIQAIRKDLMTEIAALFPEQVSIISYGPRWRKRFQLRRGLMVSVLVLRAMHILKTRVQWQMDPVKIERNLITLVARMADGNESLMDFHILPNIDRGKRFMLNRKAAWLKRGLLLEKLSDFCEVVETVNDSRRVAK